MLFFIYLNLFIHRFFVSKGIHAAFGGFNGDEAVMV